MVVCIFTEWLLAEGVVLLLFLPVGKCTECIFASEGFFVSFYLPQIDERTDSGASPKVASSLTAGAVALRVPWFQVDCCDLFDFVELGPFATPFALCTLEYRRWSKLL